MKILLVNKFYYRRGGDCIYVLNLEQLLKEHGHEVAIFAMDYPENLPSEWSRYWPSNMSKLDAFTRPFGTREVREKFSALLDDFKPDVVHLNNIHTQISPVVAKIAHEKGIRVVWTLHDTKLVCPCYTCTRNGHWCEECFADKKAVVKHRCMPGSVPGAVIGYAEITKWNKERLQEYTDLFLPPSSFMKDTMVRGGYDAEKFKVMCNFIDVNKVKNSMTGTICKENYYIFLGRIDESKGVRTLCEAACKFPYELKLIGSGPLLNELSHKYADNQNIQFLGHMNWEDFKSIIAKAKFMVLPSECSENNPLTIIEAQSLGTPVLGARIGGIPELIDEGVSGMTFTSGDAKDLGGKITEMWSATFDYKNIAEAAVKRYSSETYINKLTAIYKTEWGG